MTEDTWAMMFTLAMAVIAVVLALATAFSERQDATETRKVLRAYARAIRHELKRQPDANVRPCIERLADRMEEAAE